MDILQWGTVHGRSAYIVVLLQPLCEHLSQTDTGSGVKRWSDGFQVTVANSQGESKVMPLSGKISHRCLHSFKIILTYKQNHMMLAEYLNNYTVWRWSLLSGYVDIRGMCTYLQHLVARANDGKLDRAWVMRLMISDSTYELAALMCRREHGLRRSKEWSLSKPKCI